MATSSPEPRTLDRLDIRNVLSELPFLALELAVFFVFFGLYFLGRGLGGDNTGLATANALRIIDVQERLGFFWEPTWHEWAMRSDRFMDAANFTYMQLHFPLICAVGIIFFFTNLRKYRVLRNTLLLSGFMAMPFYWFFPVTPPRLLELHGAHYGFIDSVGTARGEKAAILTNDYAAVPSYHFGWILLLAIGVWWIYRSPILRAIAIAFLAWMTVTIVVTSNHFFLDAVAGGILVAIAFWLCVRWERYLAARPETERKWFFKRGDFRLPF